MKIVETKNILKNENTIIIAKSVFYSCLVKGGSLFIAIFTTSAYMQYFNGDAILGLWFTILSVLSWILSFDLGIGNGLRNKLVEVWVKKDDVCAKKYVTSAYIFSILIVVVIAIVILMVSRFISWNHFFNIDNQIVNEKVLNVTILIVLFSILTQFILRLITSITDSLQKPFVSNILNLITNSCLLLYVLLANNLGINNDIIRLAIVYFIFVNVPLVLATLILFLSRFKNIRPNILYFDIGIAINIFKLGVMFLWIQMMAMATNSTNQLLISKLVCSSAVVEYQIYEKIFSLVSTLVGLSILPLWSVMAKAKAEKNYRWIKSTYLAFQGIALCTFIVNFSLISVLQYVFNLWLGSESILVNKGIAIIFALYGSIMAWISIISYISNGLEELKLQIVFLTIGAILKVPLSILLVKIMKNYTAIISVNIIVYIPYIVCQIGWFIRYINKQIDFQKDNPSKGFKITSV